jgi:hypothetical protein
MLKQIKFLSTVALLLTLFQLDAMQPDYISVSVPGQNGGGTWAFRQNNIVNTRDWIKTNHPRQKIDLGQGNCISHFERQIPEQLKLGATNKRRHEKYLLYGVSQGTATVTNWVAQMPHAEQQEKIGGIILESTLGSGNSAIMHNAERMAKPITYLPFSRVWTPWVAKTMFPTYNPLGKQALKSAKKISPQIPVVIMHAPNDPELSINDSRKLYCKLRENGNQNAYLFEIDTDKEVHVDLFDHDRQKDRKIAALQVIYKKHNLPHNSEMVIPNEVPKEFQPSVQEVRRRIKNHDWKKRYVRNVIDIVSAGLALGYLYSKFAKK